MKILYTADLHGRYNLYKQLIELAEKEAVNIIIIGGDILPKDCPFEDSLKIQRQFIKETLYPMFTKFKEAHPKVRIYTMMGNDDWAINMNLLKEMEKKGLIGLLHRRVHQLDEHFFIMGYSCVPLTIFSIKDWERLDDKDQKLPKDTYLPCISTQKGIIIDIDINKWLNSHKTVKQELEEIAKLAIPKRTIYVMHAPPYGTALDVLYDGTHAGSKAIKEFILEYQPLLTLHGHIHESPTMSGKYMEIIGETICINPGQHIEKLQAVIFELPDILNKIKYFCEISARKPQWLSKD